MSITAPLNAVALPLARHPPGAKNRSARTRPLPSSWNCFGHSELNDGQRASRSAAMHLHTYRDESRSRHFDLIGGHHWSVDLVAATASGILVVGFACAVVALWIH